MHTPIARVLRTAPALLLLIVGACTKQADYPPAAPAPAIPQAQSPTEIYTYGRFRVVGNKVIGGAFKPAPKPAHPLKGDAKHYIMISFADKTLEYYRATDEGLTGEFGRAVVTPRADRLNGRVVYGRVTRIDTEPTWCPTKNIRKAYPDLPAGCIPYGHPENAMGEAKFIIDWGGAYDPYGRLHGTSGYPENFADVETFDCVRLLNEDIEELIERLGPDAVNEGIVIALS